MIIDKQLVMADVQAITGDAASTNQVDATTTNLGDGEDIRWIVHVGTAFDNLTSLDIKLRTSAASNMGTPTTLATVNVLLAGLTANTKVVDMVIPRGALRYLDTYFDVNGSNPANGTISSQFVKDSKSSKQYASGFSVS